MLLSEFILTLKKYNIDIKQNIQTVGDYFCLSYDLFNIDGKDYRLILIKKDYLLNSYYIDNIVDMSTKSYVKPEVLLKRLTNNVCSFYYSGLQGLLVYNIQGKSKVILKKGRKSGVKKLHYVEKIPEHNKEANDLIRKCCKDKNFDPKVLTYLYKPVIDLLSND